MSETAWESLDRSNEASVHAVVALSQLGLQTDFRILLSEINSIINYRNLWGKLQLLINQQLVALDVRQPLLQNSPHSLADPLHTFINSGDKHMFSNSGTLPPRNFRNTVPGV